MTSSALNHGAFYSSEHYHDSTLRQRLMREGLLQFGKVMGDFRNFQDHPHLPAYLGAGKDASHFLCHALFIDIDDQGMLSTAALERLDDVTDPGPFDIHHMQYLQRTLGGHDVAHQDIPVGATNLTQELHGLLTENIGC